nr:hypothetical protein [uncultured Allomuricauda sp.]
MRLKLYPNTLLILGVMLNFVLPQANGQTLGQDAEGFSSLVLPASVLNLDLANEIASFSYYETLSTNGNWLFGGELKGKSENGISNLFKESELAASASISSLVGHYFGEQKKPDRDATNKRNSIKQLKAALETRESDIVWEIDALLKNGQEISSMTFVENRKIYLDVHARETKQKMENHLNSLIDKRKSLENQLKAKEEEKAGFEKEQKELGNKKNNFNGGEDELQKINAELATLQEKKDKAIQEIRLIGSKIVNLSSITNRISQIIDIKNETDTLDNQENDIKDDFSYYSSLVFLRLSADGATYREDAANGAEILDDRFPRKTFNGFRAEAGVNHNIGNFYLGISLAGNYTNNLSELDATSFTLIVDDNTTDPGLLRTTRSIEAFGADEVDTFQRYDVNLDAAFLIPIRSSKELSLSINPYGRYFHYVNSEFKDRLDFGVGIFALNAAKGQLLGGALIQYNDVFGANDKPEDDFSSFDRVSFGLVVRFAFSGFDLENTKK